MKKLSFLIYELLIKNIMFSYMIVYKIMILIIIEIIFNCAFKLLLSLQMKFLIMSSGVDTLGALTEKLKQIINDTQDRYESFIDSTQLYKHGKVNEKEYFSKIGEYLVATSAMNFLAIRVILEIKSTMEKGSSLKNPIVGLASASATPQADFGINGFVGSASNEGREYTMPAPQ